MFALVCSLPIPRHSNFTKKRYYRPKIAGEIDKLCVKKNLLHAKQYQKEHNLSIFFDFKKLQIEKVMWQFEKTELTDDEVFKKFEFW